MSLLNDEITLRAVPFADIKDFTPLLKQLGKKKVVMLGASTHGTKEFYEWRSYLTSELIRQHGFNFVAIEGDWPAAAEVDRLIKRETDKNTFQALGQFERWPTWMWANDEMVGLLDWLREWNDVTPTKVGFHGLDVYSLYDSITDLISCLDRADPLLASAARKIYACFDQFNGDEKAYARSLFQNPEGCAQEVVEAMEAILKKFKKEDSHFMEAAQNARIIRNAENYYRATVFGHEDAWNVRDEHMMESLESLLDWYGPEAKGIVWAHNSHVGDFRATEMLERGQISLGGLARQRLGEEQVSLVGFSTYTGTVVASHAWDGPIEIMEVPPARDESLEGVLHNCIPQVGHYNYYLSFEQIKRYSPLLDHRSHRSIGVVYDPDHEQRRNYHPSSVGMKYDALVFLDETRAISPLFIRFDKDKIPESWPLNDRI